MLTTKSFIVTGETKTYDGKQQKNIAENVDKAVNEYLATVDGKYVDLKININVSPGIGSDHAFITVIVDVDESVKVVSKKK